MDEEPYRTALVMAEFLDGMPRYPKMHPCGVVLSRQPMSELTPTFTSNKGYPTTHFDMDAVEAIGLVKIDILAQGGLAAMRDAKAMACPARDRDRLRGRLEPWTGPERLGDDRQRRLPAPCITSKVPAMTGLCRSAMCGILTASSPSSASSVLARPMKARSKSFARRYQGMEPISIRIRRWNPACKSTFGWWFTKSTFCKSARRSPGLPPGRADVLRRA